MRLTIGDLRRAIREAVADDCFGGSYPEETYDEELAEDDAWKKRSVLVPDDVKKSISSWMGKMGLSGRRRRKP